MQRKRRHNKGRINKNVEGATEGRCWSGQAEHLPPVGVSVAIDMAASRAARRRTLKNILIHCHNFTQTGDRSERQGRLGAAVAIVRKALLVR